MGILILKIYSSPILYDHLDGHDMYNSKGKRMLMTLDDDIAKMNINIDHKG